MESFNSIQTDPSGPAFWVDSRILRLWKGTLLQMTQGKMKLVLALDGPDRAKRQHTMNLCPQFPLPYWVSKPYSGIGYPVQLEDSDSVPSFHLETTSSIMFHEHCPALIFTPYYVLKGRSMLTILSCHLDGYDFENYHYCPDYDLDVFFSTFHSRSWLTNDFPDLDLLSFYHPLPPFYSTPVDDTFLALSFVTDLFDF